jgi:hypothetical protein
MGAVQCDNGQLAAGHGQRCSNDATNELKNAPPVQPEVDHVSYPQPWTLIYSMYEVAASEMLRS